MRMSGDWERSNIEAKGLENAVLQWESLGEKKKKRKRKEGGISGRIEGQGK